MTKLADFRSRLAAENGGVDPYADLSDQQLADGLYAKSYSDMKREDFDAQLGLTKPPAAEPAGPGIISRTMEAMKPYLSSPLMFGGAGVLASQGADPLDEKISGIGPGPTWAQTGRATMQKIGATVGGIKSGFQDMFAASGEDAAKAFLRQARVIPGAIARAKNQYDPAYEVSNDPAVIDEAKQLGMDPHQFALEGILAVRDRTPEQLAGLEQSARSRLLAAQSRRDATRAGMAESSAQMSDADTQLLGDYQSLVADLQREQGRMAYLQARRQSYAGRPGHRSSDEESEYARRNEQDILNAEAYLNAAQDRVDAAKRVIGARSFGAKYLASEAAKMTTEMLPAAAAGVVTGPVGALATINAQAAPQVWAAGVEHGLDDATNAQYTTLMLAATSVPMIPVANVLGRSGAGQKIIDNALTRALEKTVAGRAVNHAVVGAGSMAAVSLLGDAVNKGYVDPNMTLGDALEHAAHAMLSGAIVTPILGVPGEVATRGQMRGFRSPTQAEIDEFTRGWRGGQGPGGAPDVPLLTARPGTGQVGPAGSIEPPRGSGEYTAGAGGARELTQAEAEQAAAQRAERESMSGAARGITAARGGAQAASGDLFAGGGAARAQPTDYEGEARQRLLAAARPSQVAPQPSPVAPESSPVAPVAPVAQPQGETATVLGQEVEKPAEPTPAQAEAGNYRKPVVKWNGLEIRVENTAGSRRKGIDENGKRWSREQHADYGYVSRTEAKDGDAVDVYMGKDHAAGDVFVIDQLDSKGRYDEAKAVVGVANEAEARALYLKHYPKGWEKRIGGVTKMSVSEFKDFVQSHHAKEPVAHGKNPVAWHAAKEADGLKVLAAEAGWQTVGGKVMREQRDDGLKPEVTGRTEWIPHAEWFRDAQRLAKLPGNKDGAATRAAVEKAIAGTKMSPTEVAHVRLMLEEIARRDAEASERQAASRAERWSGAGTDAQLAAEHHQVVLSRIENLRNAMSSEAARGAFDAELEAEIQRAEDEANEAIAAKDREDAAGGPPRDHGVPQAGVRPAAAAAGEGAARSAATHANRALTEDELKGLSDADLEERIAAIQAAQRRGGVREPDQGDLFGDATAMQNELARLMAEKDRRRNTGQESPETGKSGDLFSQARQQADLTDEPSTGAFNEETAQIGAAFEGAAQAEANSGDDFQITHVFDPPGDGVVRLADRARVHVEKHGWMTVEQAKEKIAEWKAHAEKQGETHASENGQRIVLSLFDLTGEWSKPWAEAGYQVYRFDIQADPENGDVTKFSAEFFNDLYGAFEGQDVYAVLAACPCTDFASSGARHFAAKDADGRTAQSVQLVHQTLATIEYFKPAVWAIENPVGRIEKLTGLPPWRLSFNPNELGDPYTKKTILWGRFNAELPVAPVEPTEGSKMHQKYGGKSLATKNARSVTPEGFAYGFFMANNAVDHMGMAVGAKYDRLDRSKIEKALAAGATEREIAEVVDDPYYMDLDDDAANKALDQLAAEKAKSPPPAAESAPEQPSLPAFIDAGQPEPKRTDEAEQRVAKQIQKAGTAKAADTGDVGQELTRNRRNFTGRGITWSDVEGMNSTLRAREVTKQAVWPRPDYQAMVDAGMSPQAAYLAKAVYDGLAAKPATRAAPTDQDLRDYIETIGAIREAVMELVTRLPANFDELVAKVAAEDAEAKSKGRYWGSASGPAKDELERVLGIADKKQPILDAVFPSTETRRFSGNPEYNRKALRIGGNKAIRALQYAIEDALEGHRIVTTENWPSKRDAWERMFNVVQERGQFFVTKKKSTWRKLSDGFATREEAVAKAQELAKRKDKGTGEIKSKTAVEDLKREGPERRPANANVSSQQVMDTFGFRGINFGNWMQGDTPARIAERQAHLNHAYDALTDLAEIIGVPPRALSLNGMLGLAIGAQGNGGKAAAHFVPGMNEINLTRDYGAGSLAHEWAHALDHYFAVQAGESWARQEDPFISHLSEARKAPPGVRPEIVDAIKQILTAMRQRAMSPEEAEKARNAATERARRNLNYQLNIWRQQLVPKGGESSPAVKNFDEIAERLRAGDVGEGYEGNHPVHVARIAQIYASGIGARVKKDMLATMDSVASAMRYVMSKDYLDHVPQTGTDYYKVSRGMDAAKSGRAYWATPWEMLARAFETYVDMRLQQKHGIKSPYLAHTAYKEALYALAQKASPYPGGAELQTIAAAFDKLLAEIQTRPEGKELVMFAKRPRGERPNEIQVRENGAVYGESRPVVADKNAKKGGSAQQLDIFSVTPTAAPIKRMAFENAKTSFVTVGAMRSGISRVTDWTDAAHVLAPLRRSAAEKMVALVLDQDGKPIAVIAHTMGDYSGSMVSPLMLTSAVLSVPGARSVYFAHNHPSGVLEPSRADEMITGRLHAQFDRTGVQPLGMLIFGAGRQRAVLLDDAGGVQHGNITPAVRSIDVPIYDRRFTRVRAFAQDKLESPSATIAFIKKASAVAPSGVIFLNNRHEVVGVFPMTTEEMGKVATNDPTTGISRILSDAYSGNANNAIVYGSDEAAATNVASAMSQKDLRVIDVVIDRGGTHESLGDKGTMRLGGPWARLGASSGPVTQESVAQAVADSMQHFAIIPDRVVIRHTVEELPADALAAIRRAGLDDDVVAFFHTNPDGETGVYFISGRISSLDEIPRLVAHENVVHFGLNALLPQPVKEVLLEGISETLRDEVDARGRMQWGDSYDPENNEHRRMAAEETLAYYSEQYSVDPTSIPARAIRFVQMLLDAIRTLYRRLTGNLRYDHVFMRQVLRALRMNLETSDKDRAFRHVDAAMHGKAAETMDAFSQSEIEHRRNELWGAVSEREINTFEEPKKDAGPQLRDLYQRASGEEYMSPLDVANEVVALAEEPGMPEDLSAAAKALLAEDEENRTEWGQRLNLDDAEDRLMSALERAAQSMPMASKAEREPMWYSAVTRAIEGSKRGRGTAAEWMAELRRMPGVKQAELDWLGLEPWLQTAGGRVSKDDVLNFVRQNQINVTESKRFGAPEISVDDESIENALFSWAEREAADARVVPFTADGHTYTGSWEVLDRNGRLIKLAAGQTEAEVRSGLAGYIYDQKIKEGPEAVFNAVKELYPQLEEEPDALPTKYPTIAAPGGVRYKELLLQAHPPESPGDAGIEARRKIFARYGDDISALHLRWDQVIRSGIHDSAEALFLPARIRELEAKRDAEADAAYRLPSDRRDFAGAHWDEKNVLSHIRFDDRIDADGKRVLLIHEIQSDWHQQGRKHGYEGKLGPSRQAVEDADRDRREAWTVLKRELAMWDNLGFDTAAEAANNIIQHPDWTQRWPTHDEALRNAVTEYARRKKIYQDLLDALAAHGTHKYVPSGPMQATTDWAALSVKRILRYAIENGYDKVAWLTGLQVTEIEGVGRYLDSIVYQKAGDFYDISGVRKNGFSTRIGQLHGDDLDGVLGKSLAARVRAGEGYVVGGEGYPVERSGQPTVKRITDVGRIGDKPEGMKAFYDEILRNVVSGLTKKFGARVGKTEMPDMKWGSEAPDLTSEVHSVEITPQMRAVFTRSMPMFAKRQRTLGLQPAAPQQTGRKVIGYDQARRIVEKIHGSDLVTAFRRLLNPSGLDAASKRTSVLTRAELGKLAHGTEEALHELEQFARKFDALSPNDRLAFIDAIESGSKQTIGELQPAADAIRSMMDEWREKVRALGTGALDNFIINYFPHYWKDEDAAAKLVGMTTGRRPLKGPATFLKKRTIPTTREGIDAGLTPLSTNPLILAFLKIREMQRFVTGVRLMQRLKAEKLAVFVPAGAVVPDGFARIEDAVGVVRQWSEAEGGFIERGRYWMPENAARVINNHLSGSALRNFPPAQTFRVAANMLNALQLGFSGFHLGFTTLDAIISKNALAIERMIAGEPLRAVAAMVEGMSGPGAAVANLVRGYKLLRAYTNIAGASPEMGEIVRALTEAGGRVRMDRYFLAAQGASPFHGVGPYSLVADVRHALLAPQGKVRASAAAAGRFVPEYAMRLMRDLQAIGAEFPAWQVPFEVAGRVTRASTAVIMEVIVPLQKLGVFSDLASDWLRRHPNVRGEERARAMQLIWDSVDNRLGEMVYDNLFWNRTFKDALHMGIRAVGWNLGTVREIGGAPVDVMRLVDQAVKQGKAKADDVGHRIPYVFALIVTTAVVGAIIQYLMTGKGPQEDKDYFFPRTGGTTRYGTPERISLPSYTKDIVEYWHQPGRTALNKMNPIFNTIGTIWSNEDFFGNAVYDPSAPGGEKAAEIAAFLGKEAMPFSLQGRQQIRGSEQRPSALLQAMPFVGLTPAPARITSPDEVERASQLRSSQSYMKGLTYRLRQAEIAGDEEKAHELREEIKDLKARIRDEQRAVTKTRRKARQWEKRESQKHRNATSLINGKSRPDAVAALRSAGMPATAGLLEDMPESLRPGLISAMQSVAS